VDLSQEDFGKHLGVKQNYIYLLEAGEKTPSIALQILPVCVKKETV
jgi:DNA-binding XRE family transcriptional regulator